MPFALFISSNTFKGQLPGETTLLVARKHWLTLALPMFLIIITALVPLAVYPFLILGTYANLYWFLASAFWFFLWNLLFFNLMIYSLNTVVVTNKRIIATKQLGFFKYSASEFQKDKIQDVSVKMTGILASFLNFGDLEIQTAGSQNKFNFTNLPNPEKIKQIILS
ncbi:PH domain-containing protein [Patescibacteria group bacterium]|nr:PH domain-containing protein [Patescibacteria group bacterium]MBU4466633.1 PH domain-containing protein [Patescibacteria group bacterium]